MRIEEYIAHRRMYETLVPDVTCTAYDIVMNYDLSDVRYLFDYGEYISDTEIKLAKYLNSLDQSEIDDMACRFLPVHIGDPVQDIVLDLKPLYRVRKDGLFFFVPAADQRVRKLFRR